MTPTRRALCATILIACAAHASAQDRAPRVLAEFPPGTFLENLSVAPDGAILATSYFAKTLERIDPNGSVSTFATLPAHPVSLTPIVGGWLVAAHGAPFTEGPDFAATHQFLRLDATGTVTAVIPAPDARFLNGSAALPDGRVLVADSVAGAIWAFDLATDALSVWLADAILAQPEDMAAFLPGANGLKLRDGAVYVSNSARGTLHRVPIRADGSPGAPVLVAEPGRIDDFWLEDDGAIVVATHSDALLRLAPDGTRSALLAEGCDACTAVAPRGDDWIVLTTGRMLEGAELPARVLAVPRG